MPGTCSRCGARLPFLRRLSGSSLCASCEATEGMEVESARQQYAALLAQLSASSIEPAQVQAQLPELAKRARLQGEELKRLHAESFKSYFDQALKDDRLTEDADKLLSEIGRVLGISQTTFDAQFNYLKPPLIVARANDGRLGVLANPQVMLKKGEVAHLQASATLLKEVVDRESGGTYGGVSFRVAKGVRVHTGAVGGKSIVVGTHLESADIGLLTVTSQRTIFAGQRQSIEMPHAKLLTLNVFWDGIRFHLSNRTKAPRFILTPGWGSAVAAVVNAAWQRQSD